MVMLFDSENLQNSVQGIVFATRQQEIVSNMLIKFIKESGNEITKAEMSLFATKLHEGEVILEVENGPFQKKTLRVSYNKKQFYDRILHPLKSMGMIDYDIQKKVYRLSSRFSRTLNTIASMWLNELRKPAAEIMLTVNS